ncbi:Type II secretory pathway, ATPase PulE/Tfp pilus assembly pathway, ATPase PilB [hydrothermal vent metagenome]|uniref:Type II secretory pathway, ATPase PulE/Tfp pilus assembly pathway, ATPase PilB n=1 Tax=hydrothermal vent metagenome TaxID=652676 RepID=A0A3B1BR78_9ZZZZ
MSLINDARKLAQTLLKQNCIDRTGFNHIISRQKDFEKAKALTGKNGVVTKRTGAETILFISELRVKSAGKPDGILSEEEIVEAIAKQYGIPFKKLDPLDLDIDIVANTIPKPFALKHMIVPLYEKNGVISVAIIDPESHEAMDGIARVTGKKIDPIMTTPSEINKIIHEFFGFRSSVSKAEEQMQGPQIDLGNLEQLNKIRRPDQIKSNDEHIKNAVDYLFNHAYELRASDVHIEPKRETSVVRFRIDGLLNDVYSLPIGIHKAIVSRIKMLARLNIAEKRRPQDGRIRLEFGEDVSDIRVSTMPTAFGEKLVMRVLKPEMLLRDMDTLGFFPEDLIKLERSLNKRHGIILVTGPTGSGKTTTLYSALNLLASPEKNIITVEDPIETISENFNQVATQPAVGLTFATSLRAILRQDPDIIMIGEIRDQETAVNAIQAALTGHLVLSTLHTNDTTSTITRLLDLGIEPFLLSSSVISVLAQRLVRVICPDCVVSYEVTRKKLAQFDLKTEKSKVRLKEGKGCSECRFTGYLGRTGVYEMLEIDDDIRKMIEKGESARIIRQRALKAGMTTLKENAARKMMNGVTTLSEVLKVAFHI